MREPILRRSLVLAGIFGAAMLPGRAATATAPSSEAVRCSLNYAPDRDCLLTDRVERGGIHRMVFAFGADRVTFVGRKQTGWWAGHLNGKQAMGFERNRGNMVLSTYDLSVSFAWHYPGQEHGSY